ncbi:MAG: hypothetical protein HY368_00175 [Candidatus Aenigmarchaeota archaeon]|nr:hypothetical protein [Candidatus Aenigmarchaeota archaeon]
MAKRITERRRAEMRRSARRRRERARRREAESERAKERTFRSVKALLIILAALALFLYFFVLYPAFVLKPLMGRPDLGSPSGISSEHVNWLMNEAGAYKLHPRFYFFGDPPVIETVITDQNRGFTTTVLNNVPTTSAGFAQNPDVRFFISSNDFYELYKSPDFLGTALRMQSDGRLKIDLFKNEAILRTKGYGAIYDALPKR